MSMSKVNDVRNKLQACAADVCARQWSTLGGLSRPTGDQACRAIIDPEALILLSLTARDFDPRLEDRLGWWARVGARHTSVQRMRTLVQAFPVEVGGAWRSFAAAAASHGGASWRAHVKGAPPGRPVRGRARAELDEPTLIEDAALLLRLRLGFGVNAKADILAFLIGNRGKAFPASIMAREFAYADTTIKRAARDMARAGLVRQGPGHPAVYSVSFADWAQLLEFKGLEQNVSPWQPWSLLFPFIAHAIEWTELAETLSPYLHASRARDLFDAKRDDLDRWGIKLPKPEQHPGEAFGGAFQDLLLRLCQRLRESV
jgi:hypothetical protein